MSVQADLVLQVNQQLAFARVQLEAANTRLQHSDINGRLAVHAHLDAAMRQLERAVVLFINEVAGQFGYPIDTAEHRLAYLLQSFTDQDRVVPEFNEWQQLSQQPKAWLFQFLQALHDPIFVARQFSDDSHSRDSEGGSDNNNKQASSQLIASVKSHDPLPIELLSEWLQELQAMIDRQRESLEEA